METLTTYSNYRQFKQALDAEMTRTAEGFVRIGYMLEYAADTNIINEGGYDNVNDFAKAEYGIDATQVSRFVNIYRRFGVRGEPRLQERYVNHGVAKLGIMLTLPDAVNEEIPDTYSKSEITAIKREIEAEQKISDIEVAIEAKEMQDSIQYALPEGLKQAVYQLVHDEPQLYARTYSCIGLDDLKEVLAPAGENSFVVRVKGVGRLAFFLCASAHISVTNLRDGSKETHEWQQLFDALKEYFAMGEDAAESWSAVFMEPFPGKEEPVKASEKPEEKAAKPDKHNVQQAKPKKESRVNVVVPKPKKEAPELVEEPEPPLPGQMEITEFPEYLPEITKEENPEVLTGEVVDAKDADENPADLHKDNVQQDSTGMKVEHFAPVQSMEEQISGCEAALAVMVDELNEHFVNSDLDRMSATATGIIWRIKTLKKLKGENQ